MVRIVREGVDRPDIRIERTGGPKGVPVVLRKRIEREIAFPHRLAQHHRSLCPNRRESKPRRRPGGTTGTPPGLAAGKRPNTNWTKSRVDMSGVSGTAMLLDKVSCSMPFT